MSQAKTISEEKLKTIDEIVKLCESYNTIGFVRMAKIGSAKIAALRAKLRGTALIRMAKKSIIARALEKVKGKPGIASMMDRFTEKIGPSALVFTNLPAIKIRKIFDENKTKARAKIGEIMEKDVVVPAGNTKLPPGPAITELNAAGLATKMQDGTIWITKDAVVVKAGQAVDSKVAAVLTKLNVEPVEVLIDLYVAYENNEVLDKAMLLIDVDKYKDMFLAAQSNALKLSIEAGIVSPENAKIIIQRAFTKAKALAMKLPIIIPELVKEYLAKAQAEALVLNAKVTGNPLAAPATPAQAPASTNDDPGKKGDASKEEENKEENVGLGDLFG
ncbi:MAG: 50S ribosomal protein L10 [Candidatus Lokiarchaeota archaeon]|nr:50S ribosomal protein L10 [Candidatus Lokiarchaeota archaeon]